MPLPAIFDKPHLIKLDQYDLILIQGKDTREFLNNQFTNDLKALPGNASSLGAWCSLKGCVVYTFRIWCEKEVFQLILPSVQTEAFLKRLQMYVLRADVNIHHVIDKTIYGLYGKKCTQYLAGSPESKNELVKNEDNLFINIPAPVPRIMIISGNENLEINTLSVETTEQDDHWKLLDIMAGIPEIIPETMDMFLPQMLDLERLGGLSFQKGCYPGQEIVARVKYRGELKKQLYKASVNSNSQIKPGSTLITLEDGSGTETSVGNVVNATCIQDNKWELLAVMNIAAATHSEIRLQQNKEAKLQLSSD